MAGLAPLHKPSADDLLTVQEIVAVLMPLRELRAFYLNREQPNMLAVDVVDRCIRRVSVGLVRLRAETEHLDFFEVTTK